MVEMTINEFLRTISLGSMHSQILKNSDASAILQHNGNQAGSYLLHPTKTVAHAIALSFVHTDRSIKHVLIHSTRKAKVDPLTLPEWVKNVPVGSPAPVGPNPVPRSPVMEHIAPDSPSDASILCEGQLGWNSSGNDKKTSWKYAYYVLFADGRLLWFKTKKEFAQKGRKGGKMGFVHVSGELRSVSELKLEQQEFAFVMECAKRYVFTVETFSELYAWINALSPFQLGEQDK